MFLAMLAVELIVSDYISFMTAAKDLCSHVVNDAYEAGASMPADATRSELIAYGSARTASSLSLPMKSRAHRNG